MAMSSSTRSIASTRAFRRHLDVGCVGEDLLETFTHDAVVVTEQDADHCFPCCYGCLYWYGRVMPYAWLSFLNGKTRRTRVPRLAVTLPLSGAATAPVAPATAFSMLNAPAKCSARSRMPITP